MNTYHDWASRIYAMGYEADNSYSALKCYLPFLPPMDPEEMEAQSLMKVRYEIYHHLAWLFGNEVRMLTDLDSIATNYHEIGL